MTLEDSIKELISAKYNSLKEFSDAAGIGYTTLCGILSRGLWNANFQNVAKICETLGIGVGDLAQGRIVPVRKNDAPDLREIPVIIMYARLNPQDYANYTLYGKPLSTMEGDMLLDALEIAAKIIKRWRERK